MKNELKTRFEQKFTTCSYGVGIDMHGETSKLVKYLVYSSKKKNWKKIKNSSHKLPKTAIDQFLVSKHFRG
jgi:hypothetical protein